MPAPKTGRTDRDKEYGWDADGAPLAAGRDRHRRPLRIGAASRWCAGAGACVVIGDVQEHDETVRESKRVVGARPAWHWT